MPGQNAAVERSARAAVRALSVADRALWDAAVTVLRANDAGGWTKPAPRLYPHQWSWDSAFIAIGLAHVDPERALEELERLVRAHWTDGRLPHIVFDPEAIDYFPGPDLWSCADVTDAAPRSPATSGLIQPPMHAIAVWRVLERRRSLLPRVRELYPRLFAWHRYLAERRDPEGSGLISVYHPWEGTDNTPRWDRALANLDVGELPPYARHDLRVVEAAERPTKAEYDRYLWLVGLLRAARYDDDVVQRAHPFLIKDVQCSAIFAAASRSLERIAAAVEAPSAERAEIAGWSLRFGRSVQRQWSDTEQLALDYDVRLGLPIPVQTSAGFSPLLVPGLDARLAERLVRHLFGPDFAGASGLAFPVVLSTAATSSEFRPRAYWRGPAWPVSNWLLWRGLREQGFAAEAAALRAANLALLSRPGARFAEYFEPFTAEPLGSLEQSWTAAVTLDWLAEK